MKIMAFGAHPDDVEGLCSGTLAKYRSQGHEVAIVCVTNGEVGSPVMSKPEIAALREQEARQAAAIIEAQFFWLGYPDEFLFNDPETRLTVIETIRRFDPNVILTQDKDNDYHPDHINVGQLVWDTHVMGTVPNIKTDSPPCSEIPRIFFMDTAAGIGFLPEIYVDISDYWHVKESMLNCHKSQEKWLADQYGASLVENSRVKSRFRGLQAGCIYAEAFRAARFFPQSLSPSGLLF